MTGLPHLLCASETTRVKHALGEAERVLSSVSRDKSSSEQELSRLFDPAWYGREGEWKKLSGTCVEKDTGEYVA
jgi:protein kinase C substrate 80K-H